MLGGYADTKRLGTLALDSLSKSHFLKMASSNEKGSLDNVIILLL
jgi:hypothetical protein